MMKILSSYIMVLALIFSMALPCYAAESSADEKGDKVSGDVYAKYVNDVELDVIPVVNGKAEATTDNGYTVSVTGIPDNAVVLRVVPIPSVETAAWSWFADCIGGGAAILSIFDIYFEDAGGNRINADGVKISISGVDDETIVFSVTTSGNAVEVVSAITNGSIAFTANGSHYYVLAKKTETDPTPGNNVTIADPEGGDVEISNENPEAGDTVTITPIPDDGKKVERVVVKDEDGNDIPVTDNGDGTYSYMQPDGDVTIEVTFKDEEPTPAEEYNVTIKDTSGGDVEVSDMTPTAGQTVTITPKPGNGKVVNKVTVTDENGKTVKVTDNGDGTYSYTQSAGDVTIKVTFKNKPSSDKPGSPATGDDSNIVLWTGIFILSALILLWLISGKRKKNGNGG